MKIAARNEALREQSVDALNDELLSLLREQFRLRMQKANDQLPQTHLLKQNRRDIARVKTVLNSNSKKSESSEERIGEHG